MNQLVYYFSQETGMGNRSFGQSIWNKQTEFSRGRKVVYIIWVNFWV